MSYNIRVRITKSDDHPWFWLDDGASSKDIMLVVNQLCELGRSQGHSGIIELLDGLLKTHPENLHEIIWEIPCRDENHVQETTIRLTNWQYLSASPLVAELEKLFSKYYPDWKESIVVDPV
jgi:hypothetical protein